MSAARTEGFIGQRLPRKEDERLLTGRGVYVDDIALPGMLHVAFVRSAIARGTIRAIDTAGARAMPGVRAVYTATDLAPFDIQMVSVDLALPPKGPKQPPLAAGRVTYVGEPLALVVADSRYIAEDAAALVHVDCAEEPPVITLEDARNGSPVHLDTENNVAASLLFPPQGDAEVEGILRDAAHCVSSTIEHQRVAHAPMETRGVVAQALSKSELTVYIGCQSPQVVARWLSLAFGLPQTCIRVISKDVGGSFGLKAKPGREEAAVIAAAMLLRRPLKWIEDRLENFASARQSREQECTLRVGFDEEGRLLAADVRYAANNGAYPLYAEAGTAAMAFMWSAYKVPRLRIEAKGYYSNTVGITAYRGPWAIESLARETLFDIAARRIGIDPIELRRRNLIQRADQPHTTHFGLKLEDVTPAECLEQLLQKLDIPAFRAEQAWARAEHRYLGLGVCAYIEPTAPASFPPSATDVAQVRLEPTGKVTAILSTHSQGQSTPTTMAQVIADQLGVSFDDVTVLEDDSSRGGYGSGAAGSRQAVAGGGAAMGAAALLLDKVKRLAAHLYQTSTENIVVHNGTVHFSDGTQSARPLREIAEFAYNEPRKLPAGMEAGLEAQYRYTPPPLTLSSAAHACIVEVEADTGIVHVRRWICSEDCGVVINPAVVEGQLAGGIAQAIGSVLLEEITFDSRGNPTAVTFKDYKLPTEADMPEFEFTHIVTPAKGLGGFRGVAEGGNIIGPPTLVNAIADALEPFGPVPLDLPLTPSKLLAVIEGRSTKR